MLRCDVLGLAATVMEMLPVPVPEVGTTVIQRLVVIAFQAQVEFEVVTVVENVPPPTGSV
jgi:hypothetical protein